MVLLYMLQIPLKVDFLDQRKVRRQEETLRGVATTVYPFSFSQGPFVSSEHRTRQVYDDVLLYDFDDFLFVVFKIVEVFESSS